MARIPSEDARKVKAYLDGYISGLQHAQQHIDPVENAISLELIQAEEAALNNITWFMVEEFGDFDTPPSGIKLPSYSVGEGTTTTLLNSRVGD